MSKNSNISISLFLITFALAFYCLGASFIEAFVNYRTWPLVGTEEFRVYHQTLTTLVVRLMVIPIAIKSFLVAVLFLLRPSFAPRWALGILLILEIVGWVSSITIQIPIQQQLSETGFSQDLLDQLIATDWIRKTALIVGSCVFFWLMMRLSKEK